MTTLHEQARAEAEKRFPDTWKRALQQNPPDRDRDIYVGGFLAGHEAATRTRVVTTVDMAVVLAQHSGWGMTGPDIHDHWEVECFDCGELLGDLDTLISEWEAQTGKRHMDHADHGRHPANDRALAWHQAEKLVVLYDPEETP